MGRMDKQVTELSPFIKWAGGKEQELKFILPNMPVEFSRFVEPFVGGGAVYLSMKCRKKTINDKSTELISLYKDIKYNNSELVNKLQSLLNSWVYLETFLNNNMKFFTGLYSSYKNGLITKNKLLEDTKSFIRRERDCLKTSLNSTLQKDYQIFEQELIRNIVSKITRIKKLEKEKGDLSSSDLLDNFECALKSSFYMFIRVLYNRDQNENIEYFYFIREFCYSSMFRYNSNGDFNVPYGGISYNRKNFQKKIDYIKSELLQNHFKDTELYNLDFEDFFNTVNLNDKDFIFLDPPYDSEFSNYANNTFNETDQRRLANYLIKKCPSKFMMVIKNTQLIKSLYKEGVLCKNGNAIKLNSFDKKYLVSFKNRNNKNAEHLLITNY